MNKKMSLKRQILKENIQSNSNLLEELLFQFSPLARLDAEMHYLCFELGIR